ncbi:CLIP domain-containing serine protease B8-like [Sabethes cyaneus]|uniref:CLIP domain-containing serine protease B8-like n=1 Tax=Sabethes cyaneus TaxID=53552 RepID=UPI00237DDCE8|nr:CLIP domain-containing serine protease B8-like [Sabethes cyaneus]
MLTRLILLVLLIARSSQQQDELPVWESHTRCSIPNESSDGICVSPSECHAYQQISNPSEVLSVGRVSFISALQCSSDNQTLICCPQGHSYKLPQLSAVNVKQRDRNNSLDVDTRFGNDDDCGIQTFVPKILGSITAIDEFPWAALLFYRNGLQGCGAVVIGRSHVLTAAHCVTGKSYDRYGPLQFVRLREYNIHSDPDCMIEYERGSAVRDCAERKIDARPLAIIIHPDYVSHSDQQHHDIALIKIDRIAEYTDFLRPICLPERGFNTGLQSGKTLNVCGWGKTNFFGGKTNSPIKMKSLLPFVDPNNCREAYRSQQISLSQGQICAGGRKGHDSCAGDSGSPLMFYDSNRQQWVLAGIVSRGAMECGTADRPGIYTNVREYLPWIKRHTN